MIKAAPLERQFENLAQSWRGSFSGVAYANALERLRQAPAVAAVPLAQYNELLDKCQQLQEKVNILEDALEEYERKDRKHD